MDKTSKNKMKMPYLSEDYMGNEDRNLKKKYVFNENNWKVYDGKQEKDNKVLQTQKKMEERNMVQAEMTNSIPWGKLAVAMAFVPKQEWAQVYADDVAFERGTIFPELDKPFIGEGVPE